MAGVVPRSGWLRDSGLVWAWRIATTYHPIMALSLVLACPGFDPQS